MSASCAVARCVRSLIRQFFFLFLRLRPPPRSPLFPYTPLFRSLGGGVGGDARERGELGGDRFSQRRGPGRRHPPPQAISRRRRHRYLPQTLVILMRVASSGTLAERSATCLPLAEREHVRATR